ncbi:Mating-type switching protein swi10 [Papilio machaon]|uniref:Mating-type switching protein swi10 n=1 Tax=Papilio machaon TaxID=76193 RepID=A0A194RSF2_PAPMA|nr:Mating-type switching protein swi10 [Papilio machaon]
MELEDGFDDLLAEIDEPTVSKKPKTEQDDLPGPSKPSSSKTHCVLVNQKQRGNPLLKFITSVAWEYDEIIPDYEIGKTICILFLSTAYHNLNPDYLNNRIKELGKKYDLRVLLVQIINALSNIKPVNKTDAMTLLTNFGTLANIIKANESRLADCPGFGPTKAKKLYKALHEPFLKRGNIIDKEVEKSEDFGEDLNMDEIEKAENEIKNQ